MGVEIRIAGRHPVTVLVIEGDADPAALARVGDDIADLATGSVREPLVVDVSGLSWVHPAAIASLLAHLGASNGSVRLVCDRLTGRRLLRRCLPAQLCPPLFGSVDEAVGDLVEPRERSRRRSTRRPRHDEALARPRLVDSNQLKPAI